MLFRAVCRARCQAGIAKVVSMPITMTMIMTSMSENPDLSAVDDMCFMTNLDFKDCCSCQRYNLNTNLHIKQC